MYGRGGLVKAGANDQGQTTWKSGRGDLGYGRGPVDLSAVGQRWSRGSRYGGGGAEYKGECVVRYQRKAGDP
jgi:hypothetical protein